MQLTVFIIIFWIITPILSTRWIGQILTQIFILNSILVTLSASKQSYNLKRIVWTLWGLAATGAIMRLFPELRLAGAHLETIFRFLLLLVFIINILSFVFTNQQVTIDSIFAAFVAYLMIAFAFADIYIIMAFWNPESFKGLPPTTPDMTDMVYFSMVTIATLGYGDIVPVTTLARTVTVLEAVIGQFYVAVIVAVLVGIFISHQSLEQRDRRESKV